MKEQKEITRDVVKEQLNTSTTPFVDKTMEPSKLVAIIRQLNKQVEELTPPFDSLQDVWQVSKDKVRKIKCIGCYKNLIGLWHVVYRDRINICVGLAGYSIFKTEEEAMEQLKKKESQND